MNTINDDLISDGEVNPLADALRAANVKIEQLTQAHRQSSAALGRIAAAAGVHLNGSLEGVVDAVIAQLINVLTAPPAEVDEVPPLPEVSGGLACEMCGSGGAADMDGAALCRVCSGGDTIAEARAEGLLT